MQRDVYCRSDLEGIRLPSTFPRINNHSMDYYHCIILLVFSRVKLKTLILHANLLRIALLL